MSKKDHKWKELGDRVARARQAARLSQQELASKINLERTVLTKIETGARGLDALELARLASVLKRPIDWFVTEPSVAVAGRRAARSSGGFGCAADVALTQ